MSEACPECRRAALTGQCDMCETSTHKGSATGLSQKVPAFTVQNMKYRGDSMRQEWRTVPANTHPSVLTP